MPGPRVGPLGTATERIGSIGDTCYAKTETFCISQVCNLTEMRCLSLLGLVSEMPATLRSARPLAYLYCLRVSCEHVCLNRV